MTPEEERVAPPSSSLKLPWSTSNKQAKATFGKKKTVKKQVTLKEPHEDGIEAVLARMNASKETA